MLAGPIGGTSADRLGRRPTLLVGTAGSGALMLALGLARSTAAIVAIAPVLGFFTDACRAPLQAAVADVVPPRDRARAYGLLYWAINLGFAAAASFGGALAAHHFGLLFVIDALTTFGYGAFVLFGVPETRPPPVFVGSLVETRGPARMLDLPLHDAPFVKFVLIQMLLLLAFVQVLVTLPLDMRAHGLGLARIGLLLGLNGVFIVIGQPIALRALRRFGHLQWLVAGAVLTGIGLGANAFAGPGQAQGMTHLRLPARGGALDRGRDRRLVVGAGAGRRFRPGRSSGCLPGDLSARLGRRQHPGADAGVAGARAPRSPGALARLSRRLPCRRGAAPQDHGAAPALDRGSSVGGSRISSGA